VRGVARIAVSCLTLLSFTACTTLRPLEDFSPSRIRSQIEVGDDVRIVTLKGVTYELTVTGVQDGSLTGRAASGKRWRIHYEAIQYIEVEEADLVGTAGGLLTTVYVTAVVILTAALISWSREMDDD
jgi:hypothetical protein